MEEGKRDEKKKVMVALDESEISHYALEWTLDKLKDSIADSHLIIFTAQPLSDVGYIYAASMGAAPADLIASVQETQKKVALLLLAKAKDICAKNGIVAETLTEVGDPKSVICEVAEKQNVELLILGSHNRGPVKRAFLGSVSNYCVHNAKCPVLIVKKPA